MTEYKISRENAERDWDALRAILDNDGIVAGDVEVLEQIAQSVRAQIPKLAVKEPTEWGSVVRARRVGYGSEDTTTLRWQRQNSVGDAWISEPAGDLEVRYHSDWRCLRDPEVLRVGIGEPTLTEAEIDKQATEAQRIIHAGNSVAAGEIVPPDHELAAYYDEMNRVDDANTDYLKGVEDFAAKVRREVAALRSTVVTAPEKRTCDDTLALVAALLGDS